MSRYDGCRHEFEALIVADEKYLRPDAQTVGMTYRLGQGDSPSLPDGSYVK
jgi:hypothetical protein